MAGQVGVGLPALPRLFGRDRDLEGDLGALSESIVVSLLGPGGVGKTSLAVAIAHSVTAERLDGVIFVDLAVVADQTAVLPAIRHAASLSAPVVSDAESIETIGAPDALIVLDNFKHLADSVVETVGRLVAGEGPATVLLTSRERLGITDERACDVRPSPRRTRGRCSLKGWFGRSRCSCCRRPMSLCSIACFRRSTVSPGH